MTDDEAHAYLRRFDEREVVVRFVEQGAEEELHEIWTANFIDVDWEDDARRTSSWPQSIWMRRPRRTHSAFGVGMSTGGRPERPKHSYSLLRLALSAHRSPNSSG